MNSSKNTNTLISDGSYHEPWQQIKDHEVISEWVRCDEDLELGTTIPRARGWEGKMLLYTRKFLCALVDRLDLYPQRSTSFNIRIVWKDKKDQKFEDEVTLKYSGVGEGSLHLVCSLYLDNGSILSFILESIKDLPFTEISVSLFSALCRVWDSYIHTLAGKNLKIFHILDDYSTNILRTIIREQRKREDPFTVHTLDFSTFRRGVGSAFVFCSQNPRAFIPGITNIIGIEFGRIREDKPDWEIFLRMFPDLHTISCYVPDEKLEELRRAYPSLKITQLMVE